MTSPYTCDTVGVLGPTAFAVASWEAGEALKILAGRKANISRKLLFFDLWNGEVDLVPVQRDPECPVCGHKKFSLLKRRDRITTTTLCGRNAVQLVPAASAGFNFELTLATLARAFPVESNGYLFEAIAAKEAHLARTLVEGLKNIPAVKLYCPPEGPESGIVSFTITGQDVAVLGTVLDQAFGIGLRAGLHCSPSAHRAIGTFPEGTLRASIGYFNSAGDVERLLAALRQICLA